jgi:membrane-associated phospholipid phosphatase
MKRFLSENRHLLWILYIPIYFVCFFLLEKRTDVDFHIIHCFLDDRIPFLEYFIIPYYLWFVYIFTAVGIFVTKDVPGFKRLAWHLALGMTVFLIVSALYPNMLTLRPEVFPRDNIFTWLVGFLYQTDTPTNVLPSIHVYNSICVYIAVAKSKAGREHLALKLSCLILSLLIILSTVFLKQHSVIDVCTAILMALIFYFPIYRKKEKKEHTETV